MKKVLITGSGGFFGTHCMMHFKKQGYEVYCIDHSGKKNSNTEIGEISVDNICNFQQQFDFILHFAGGSSVAASIENPEAERRKTIESLNAVIKFMADYNPNAKLIYPSSAAVYGNLHNKKIKETDALNPVSPYGFHKMEAEDICIDAHNKYGLCIHIIRFFSIYGEKLKKQLLFDTCMRMFPNLDSREYSCFGTGKEIRDFVYISDAIRMIELVLQENNSCTINGGNGKAATVLDAIKLIANQFNYNPVYLFSNINLEGNPFSLLSDNRKLKELGYEDVVSLENGIDKYVRWFKSNY